MDRILAIAGLRFRLMRRRLEGVGGILNMIGAALLALFGLAFALGGALGFGFMIWSVTGSGDPEGIRIGFLIVFYAGAFLGVVVPLVRGAIDEGFDVSPFVIYPISRTRLYAMTVTASAIGTDHLLYYPFFIATFLTGALVSGFGPLVAFTLIALLVVVLVAWSNLLALVLVSLMRARRIREVVIVVALGALILASMAPVMFDDTDFDLEDRLPDLEAALETTVRALRLLPPSIAAEGMTALHTEAASPSASLLGLLSWALAGLAGGFFVFSRYHLGERSVKASKAGPLRASSGVLARALSFDVGPLGSLPSEVRAIASKELRYLLRSVVGRFVMLMSPLFVFVIVFALRPATVESWFGLEPQRMLLFGMMLYTVLFSNNFVFNSFAWEGDGVKAYFLAPISLSRVLFAKNLGTWLYNVILLGLVLSAWSILMGIPDPRTLISALLMYGTALVGFTVAGNPLSVLFPVPRDISTAKNQPSRIAVLLSLVVLMVGGGVLGTLVAVPVVLGWSAAQPFLLAGALAVTIVLYVATLRYSARLMGERREKMMEDLKKVA